MNRVIIGDNLDILTNKKHLDSKYKVIYLDPPYNTLSSKSYNDTKSCLDWRNDFQKRIVLCKDYLKNDGVVFISIDDSEIGTVRTLCDETFGRNNFIGTFITRQAMRSNAKHMNITHEYVVCYAYDKTKVKPWKILRINTEDGVWIKELCYKVKELYKTDKESAKKYLKKYIKNKNLLWLRNYNLIDEEGEIFFGSDLSTPSQPREVIIDEINLHLFPLQKRGWVSDECFIELHKRDLLYFRDDRPYEKKYLINAEDCAPSILNFYSRQGTKDLEKLGLGGLFDTPKSVDLLKYIFRFVLKNDDNVLDIYAGSGSTAQACIELNKNISWTLIQKDEIVDEKSPIYKNCCKIGIEPNIKNILFKRLDTIKTVYETY